MAESPNALRPEVAVRYALSAAGHTRLFVTRLDREVDLTQLTLEEADELMAMPGGFEWLVPIEQPETNAGTVADTTAPAKGKRKKGA